MEADMLDAYNAPVEGATGGAPVFSVLPEKSHDEKSLPLGLSSEDPARLLELVQRLMQRVTVLESDSTSLRAERRKPKAPGTSDNATRLLRGEVDRLSVENAELKRTIRAKQRPKRDERSPQASARDIRGRPEDSKMLDYLRAACKEHELENGRLRERLGAAQTKIASQQQLLQKEKREIQRLTREHVKLTAQIVELKQRLGEVSQDSGYVSSQDDGPEDPPAVHVSPEQSVAVLDRIKQELCDAPAVPSSSLPELAASAESAAGSADAVTEPTGLSDCGSPCPPSSRTVDPPTPSSLVREATLQDGSAARFDMLWVADPPPAPAWEAPAPWVSEDPRPVPEPESMTPLPPGRLPAVLPPSTVAPGVWPPEEEREGKRHRKTWGQETPPLVNLTPGSQEFLLTQEGPSRASVTMERAWTRSSSAVSPPDAQSSSVSMCHKRGIVNASLRNTTHDVRATTVRQAISPRRISPVGLASRIVVKRSSTSETGTSQSVSGRVLSPNPRLRSPFPGSPRPLNRPSIGFN